jgi:TonB family protein
MLLAYNAALMIWKLRKRAAVLLPLFLAIPSLHAGSAQEPPQLLKPQPARFLLGGVEPLLDDQMKVVELLTAKRWQEARALARQQFHVVAGFADDYPATAATGLVLAALADAGLGDESLALCRWDVAQNLDPQFAKADFSNFGEAGALLGRHLGTGPAKGLTEAESARLKSARMTDAEKAGAEHLGPDSKVTKPEIVFKTPPEYTLAARKEKLEGKVVVESIIDKDGHIVHARLLQTQPKGLGLAALDAMCNWRFKPSTLNGEPVKVYYVLTVNFTIEKTPAPPALPHP